MGDSITARVVEFVTGTRPEQIPEAARHIARRAFIDTIGVTLLGFPEEPARILRAYASEEDARPRSLILGSDQRTSPQLAALVNGATGHALDYDDYHRGGGHFSTVLVPTVLAVAEDVNASGLQALAAYCVAFEVVVKIGWTLLGDDWHHYARGWHSTATLGVMGATMAAAYLQRLTPAQTACALGLAASHAAGLRKNFGTMAKSFHAGNAARGGVVSARLAKAGYDAHPAILDAPLGFFDVLAEGRYDPSSLERVGQGWELADGMIVKKYSCCGGTQRAADALLESGAVAFRPEEIESVEVHMPVRETRPLIHDSPHAGQEARFSVQYVTAAALVDGAVNVASFTDEMVQRPMVQELIPKVRKIAYEGDGPLKMVIRTKGGEAVVRTCDEPRGSIATPLSDAEIDAKYGQCAGGLLGATGVARSLEALHGLEKLPDIHTLTGLLVARRLS